MFIVTKLIVFFFLNANRALALRCCKLPITGMHSPFILSELRYGLEQISLVRYHSFVWNIRVYLRREAALLVVATRIHYPDVSRF